MNSSRLPWRIAWISAGLLALVLFLSVAEARSRGPAAPPIEPLGEDPAIASPSLPTLPTEATEALRALTPDPPPPRLIRNSQYWVSNEHHHEVFYPKLKGLGGALMGVGSDQNYLFAGWSDADLLILMDFDGQIQNLHRLYGALFMASATPARFLQRWETERAAESLRLILRAAGGDAKLEKVFARIFRFVRAPVRRRLVMVQRKYAALGIPTFLDDQKQYERLRTLWQQGRVVLLRGDLTGKLGMSSLSRALRKASLKVKVLYLSNAEQYFVYSPQFRRNIIDLPWADGSIAMRTLAWGIHGLVERSDLYHYNVQPGENFAAWMARSRQKLAGHMLMQKTPTGTKGFSVMEKLPPPSKQLPEVAPGSEANQP